MAAFTPTRKISILPPTAELGQPYSLPPNTLCECCRKIVVRLSSPTRLEASHESSTGGVISWDFGTLTQARSREACQLCQLVASACESHIKSPHDMIRICSNSALILAPPVELYVPNAHVGGIETVAKMFEDFPTDNLNAHLEPIRVTLCSCCSLPKLLCPQAKGQIDFEAVRIWLQDCVSNHKGCQAYSSDNCGEGVSMYPSILIDVVQKCLVHVTSTKRYCALSYVYGGYNNFTVNKNNFEMLQKPESLLTISADLPSTILDAMELTTAIGERYLWVDSLCIIHDDHTTFDNQISHMNLIYSRATLTLAIISGSNADEPIPGVRHTSRKPIPTASLWGETLFLLPSRLSSQLYLSAYDSRAWVFQEQLLSLRCLFITSDEVHFLCRERCHRELIWSTNEAELYDQQIFTEDLKAAQQRTNPLHAPSWDQSYRNITYSHLVKYFDLVRRYSQKKLTHEGDMLRAFAGIVAILANEMNTEFFEGLPQSDISLALHWIPGYENRGNCATGDRGSSNTQSVERHWRRREFPSFSWAGWCGPVEWLEAVISPSSWQYQTCIDTFIERESSQACLKSQQCTMARIDGLTICTSDQDVVASGVNSMHAGEGYILPLHKIFDSDGNWCGRLCERSVPADFSKGTEPNSCELRLLLLSQCLADKVHIKHYSKLQGSFQFPFDNEIFAAYHSEADTTKSRLCNLLVVSPTQQSGSTSNLGYYERIGLCQIHKTVWDDLEKEEGDIHLV